MRVAQPRIFTMSLMCGLHSLGNQKANIILNLNIHSSHSIGGVQGLLYLHTQIKRNLTPLNSSSKIPLRKKKGPSIVAPFQVQHKLYYFTFVEFFRKKNINCWKYNQSGQELNPWQVQLNNEAFCQSNQKHNKKLMKTLIIIEFISYMPKFSNQKLISESKSSNYINYLIH